MVSSGAAATLIGIYRAVRTWLPVWWKAIQRRSERWWQLVRLQLGPLVVYGWFVYSGYQMLTGQPLLGAQLSFSLAPDLSLCHCLTKFLEPAGRVNL
jgi:hypothetical protein